MSTKLTRIRRLEEELAPGLPPQAIIEFSHQAGLAGDVESITDQEVIAAHVLEHPEDAGRDIKVIRVNFIHPTGVDGEGNHVW